MYRQVNELAINRHWLVYESPEAHACAFPMDEEHYSLRNELVEAYSISQGEAEEIIKSQYK